MTSLLKRVIEDKRALVLFLCIGIVANVLAYTVLVRPRGARAAGVVDRAAAAARARNAAEREQAQARDLVSGGSRAAEELAAFYAKVLPASRDDARRMMDETLPAMAEKTRVRWLKRTSEVSDADVSGAGGGAGGNDARLGQVTINMVLQGEYADLRNFLYSVESAAQFIVVDDVMLSEGQPDEPLTLAVRMSTFFRKPNGA
jgi:hypothetical protein